MELRGFGVIYRWVQGHRTLLKDTITSETDHQITNQIPRSPLSSPEGLYKVPPEGNGPIRAEDCLPRSSAKSTTHYRRFLELVLWGDLPRPAQDHRYDMGET